MKNYKNIEYLKTGKPIQRKSYEILKKLKVMEFLKEYFPLLTGTIPIGINIDNSDLDIICDVKNFDEFEKKITDKYGNLDRYRVRRSEAIVINFIFEEIEIEIYGEDKPTENQNAYKHMLVEAKLLEIGGNKLKKEIINLKEQGIKTEPAFCKVLGVEGNPYENMLDEKLMLNCLKRSLRIYKSIEF